MKIVKRRLSYAVVNGRLRLKLRWNEEVLTLGLGINIDKESESGKIKWDGRRCINGTRHGKEKVASSIINRQLMEIENKIDMAFYKFEVMGYIPGLEDMKRELIADYDEKQAKKAADSVENLFNRFISEESDEKGWSFNTVKSVMIILKLVKQFDPKAKINHIDREWLFRFVNYQKHHRLSGQAIDASGKSKGYANNVIAKNCRIFKWFLKWAVNKKIVDRALVDDFRPTLKTIKKPVIFLTWEELMKFWNIDLSAMQDIRLDEARDIFCFQCFTSLRYSDAHNLRKVQVTEDAITITAQKTATPLEIELNKYSRAILEKYAGTQSEYALPRMTVSNLNQFLKKLGKRLEIDTPVSVSQFYGSARQDEIRPKYELLSSHAGRRTFICNALAMGISPSVVMKWTGHSEYSAMKPYIDIADDIKKKSMKLFDEQ